MVQKLATQARGEVRCNKLAALIMNQTVRLPSVRRTEKAMSKHPCWQERLRARYGTAEPFYMFTPASLELRALRENYELTNPGRVRHSCRRL
jgi:hypothetical protein